MALRGIDAQIMVVRATELSASQVKSMRQHDTSQSIFASQLRAQSELNRNKTLATVRIDNGKVRLDAEKERQDHRENKKKKQSSGETVSVPEAETTVSMKDLPVTPSEHRLDLKV